MSTIQKGWAATSVAGLTLVLSGCGSRDEIAGQATPAPLAVDVRFTGLAASTAPLPVNTYRSLQVTTPGFTDRSLLQSAGLGFTEVVSAASAPGLRQDASFRIVKGLGDANCSSFESQNIQGQYLRHQGSRVKLAASDGSAGFNADATWCARPGLSGVGVSLESLNFAGRYLRYFGGEVWLAQPGGGLPSDAAGNFNQDSSWNLITAWNRSGVALPLAYQSWQVTNAGLTDRYLRHQNGLGYTTPVTAASDSGLKQDASFNIVPGLADAGCYSFEASNFAGSYLRHSAFRVRLDANDNTPLFRADATFCTQPGLSGAGVSLEAYNLPGLFVRHAGGEVWMASGAGARPSDGAASFAQDASWGLANPWATGSTPPPPPPSGPMSVKLVNATNGTFPDAQLYWAIIGYNPATAQLSYVDRSGNLVAAAAGDNDAPGHLSKNGVNYSNYFNRLSEAATVPLPKINSGRMFLSLGTPMYIRVIAGTGPLGFAGPDINNPADPNQDVYFDFIEFTFNQIGYFGNTTRVDQFGFPLRTRLIGKDGSDQTRGETASRASIFNDFNTLPNTEFHSLIKAPYRIVALVKGSFGAGRPNAGYFDAYVGQVWNSYRNTDLIFTAEAGTFRGRVIGNDFVFSKDGGPANLYIRGKPTTQNLLEASGNLASGSASELVVQAQVAAALNRHLLITTDPSLWSTDSAYYQQAPANFYAKFWHDHSVDGRAYGFAYDDVRAKSSVQENTNPAQLTVTVGW